MRFLDEISREPDHARYGQVNRVYPDLGLTSDFKPTVIPLLGGFIAGEMGLDLRLIPISSSDESEISPPLTPAALNRQIAHFQ